MEGELIFDLSDDETGIATWIVQRGQWYHWYRETPNKPAKNGCRSKDLTLLSRWASAWFEVRCAYQQKDKRHVFS